MTSLMRWDPVAELESLMREPFWSRSLRPRSLERDADGVWLPAMDLVELKDALVARLELPGVAPKQIEVSLQGEYLTIRGKRDRDGDGTKYLRREIATGVFERSVQLPYPVNGDKVKATYQNGVLAIHMPKAREHRGRQIPIDIR